MWEWLLSPVDPSRAHDVGFAISWHARSMVIAWGVLSPLAVLTARFFKVMPGQNWPRDLDNTVWWRSHWMGHSVVVGLSIFALALVLPTDFSDMDMHNWLGYLLLLAMGGQVLLGVFRGSKGGPTSPSADGSLGGDHYDMTPWRRMFELLHKIIGYSVLLLAIVVIFFGLWKANAPTWMVVTLTLWWLALIVIFYIFQRRKMAVDTYQAIWGPDPIHPGNATIISGWGVRRFERSAEDRQNQLSRKNHTTKLD